MAAMRRIMAVLAMAGGALPAAQGPRTATLRSGTQEVLVDIVARDKKGRLIADLKPDHLRVFEDGKPQAITSFRFVDGRRELARATRAARRGQPTVEGAAAAAPAAGGSRPHLVSLVFGGMEPFGRLLAAKAARLIVNSPLPPNTWVAVFSLDNRLNILQSFTTDRARLEAAVELAVSGQPAQFRRLSDITERELKTLMSQQRIYEGVGFLPGAIELANQPTGRTAANHRIMAARMLLQLLDFTQATSEYQASSRALFGLQALAQVQAALPGRKTVVYLSEGLYIHPERRELFAAVLSAANQAHASFYTIDVRALESISSGQAVREALAAAMTASRVQQEQSGREADRATASRARAGTGVTFAGDPVTARDKITVFDAARDSIQADTQSGLAALAGGTGGFLVANTNDLEPPVRAIIEDIGTYYELTYRPAAKRLDGRFRRIEVKAARPGVRVQGRAGYLALPALEQPLLPYELALLRAIEADPRPRALDFHAQAVRLRPEAGGIGHAVIFELPALHVAVTEDQPAAEYRAHVAFLALVKDAGGRLVGKLSRDIPFSGPLDRLPAFRASAFVHVQALALAPGRYTLQTAAADLVAGTSSARESELVVAPAEDPGVSGIVHVLRVSPAKASAQPNPLEAEGETITPTLSRELARPARLYFVVAAAAGRPEVAIEYSRGETVVRRAALALPEKEAGAFPLLADVPADLEPGDWDVRVTARSNGRQASSASHIRLAETGHSNNLPLPEKSSR